LTSSRVKYQVEKLTALKSNYNAMNKHITENTQYFGLDEAKEISFKNDGLGAIQVKITDEGKMKWTGEVMKIYHNKMGEPVGYDVYIY
jgi:hypothetical protein